MGYRGPRKHMKRLNAPRHWMLDKLSGAFAPRPSSGPHKVRECLPLILLLRNRLKYALTGSEVKRICKQRLIKVDGKVRTDICYPAGFMDVIEIEKTKEWFRLLYDVKGRFRAHRISETEAEYKLCRVTKTGVAAKNVPFIVTHDGRTIRYPNPAIKKNDTIQIQIKTGTIMDYIKFDHNQIAMITAGRNLGRIGIIRSIRHEKGSHDIVQMTDENNNKFATRADNVFVIGQGRKPWVSFPKGNGVRKTIAEERDIRLKRADE
ncbi:hypothetical protein SNEBB_005253 [Seison nebaliae]|nr:hypothetical protein SNEBB_005253 [Seison nebaliae]